MADELEFTGERFTPECIREIWYEHMHRYAWALSFARGKRVLDAACGEGYGSVRLAAVADQVVGVDIDQNTVQHAQSRYGATDKLSFQCGDVTALDELPDNSFDLITSFETLEHVEAQERMLAGFARLLAPGGMLLISSPDKAEYSDRRGFQNEFHVRELYRDELQSMLDAQFRHVHLLGQKLMFQSVVWDLGAGEGAGRAVTDTGDGMRNGLHYPPMYFLAICSQQAIEQPDALHLFGDAAESVYDDYNQEVRRNMAAREHIASLDQRIEQLQQQLAQAQAEAQTEDEPVATAASPKRRWWHGFTGRQR